MNGPHDVGGLHGFGPVVTDEDAAPFHDDWERRLFALTLAMGASGSWNLDQSRSARESMGARAYRQSSYYQIWHAGLVSLLLEREMVSAAELDTGEVKLAPVPIKRKLNAGQVRPALLKGAPVDRPVESAPLFKLGDQVVTKNHQPATHTRLPAYIRNRPGKIALIHGAHVFADEHARSGAEAPQWLYSVCFDAADLFGPDTSADSVYVDCWESYLDGAG